MTEVTLEDSFVKAMDSQEFEKGSWPDPEWWNLFDDTQLSSFVEIALTHSPTMQMAEAKVKEIYARARGTKSFLYPDLDVYFSDNWEHLSKGSLFRFPPSLIPSAINQLDLSLNFRYEFDIWGKNLNLYRAELGMARAEMAEAAQVRLVLSVQVCKEYYNVQINEKKQMLYNELLSLRSKRFELIQERFTYGLDSRLQILVMERAVQEVQQELQEIQNEIAQNRHSLNVLMGNSPDTHPLLMLLKKISFDKPFPLPENLSLDLLSRRADISAAIWRLEAQAKKVGAAKAAFYPNINLMALAGFESLSWADFLSPANFQGFLNPALNLPIFKGGRLRAHLKEALATFDAAVGAYNATVLQAAKEAADSISSLILIDRQALIHFESLLSALNTVSIHIMRFQQGVDNRLVAIQAQEMALQEEISQLDLERLKIFTVLKLIQALGGGFYAPTTIPINPQDSHGK